MYSDYQIDILDAFIGSTISRYDDSILVTSDNSIPMLASTSPITGNIRILIGDASVDSIQVGEGTTLSVEVA